MHHIYTLNEQLLYHLIILCHIGELHVPCSGLRSEAILIYKSGVAVFHVETKHVANGGFHVQKSISLFLAGDAIKS